jgi:hypothetical protein
MPNWCSNSVELKHEDPAKITWIETTAGEKEFMNTIVPRPVTENDNWYDWNIANWGTKWDIDAEITSQNQNSITFYFDSAWSPPIEFYKALEEMGFEVSATYCEPGACYVGKYENGEDDCYDYSAMTSVEVESDIPSDLNNEYGISDSLKECEDEDNG